MRHVGSCSSSPQPCSCPEHNDHAEHGHSQQSLLANALVCDHRAGGLMKPPAPIGSSASAAGRGAVLAFGDAVVADRLLRPCTLSIGVARTALDFFDGEAVGGLRDHDPRFPITGGSEGMRRDELANGIPECSCPCSWRTGPRLFLHGCRKHAHLPVVRFGST